MQGKAFNSGLGVLLVVLLGIAACGARPPRGDAAVFGDSLQDLSQDNENALGPLEASVQQQPGAQHPASNRLLASPEDTALAALQLQLLQQYANYNSMRNLPWEQLMRSPIDKRQMGQIRYRQCYFNPISCFRK